MLIIYFSIFKQLENEVKNLGYDINELKKILSKIKLETNEKVSLEDRGDLIFRDFQNIDKILGLQVTNRYFC